MTSISSLSMFIFFILMIISSMFDSISSTVDSSTFSKNNPPDLWLDVPNLTVDQVSFVAENLKVRASLSANVASLISVNVGIDVSSDKANLTMKGVETQGQLAVHLNNVAEILTRTMASLDLNPLLVLITGGTFKSFSNLLAVFKDNGQLIYQIINSVGQIVNQVIGPTNEILLSTVVGDYHKNMTFTGLTRTLENGYVIKQFSYPSSSSSFASENMLINIVFDIFGNVLNTHVVHPPSSSSHMHS